MPENETMAEILASRATERGERPADWLRRAFAAAARIEPSRVDADVPLSALGLDSLAAVELQQGVEEAVGISISLEDLLAGMTLRELEHVVEQRMAGGEASSAAVAASAPLSPGAGEAAGEHPLSWNQRSLWFLHRLAPESSAYNIAGAARLGPTSPETLRHALQELVDRHPMLRTTFAETPGGPVQQVAARAAAGFEIVEATDWSDEEVSARLHSEAFRPFDLATGPLLRAVLLRRGDEAFLVLAVHHIVADFGSMAVLVRELGLLVAGETLPPLAALYTDFARRQERMLLSPAGERLWEHWRERLAGVPQLDLPTDRPRRPVQTLRGGVRTLPASPERAAAVHRLAATHGSTPFVALLAAWQAVLARWSGQEDFLTGAPMAGRSAREWGEVVGYFVNLVPLHADLSANPAGGLAVSELMARTRRTVLDALAHQDLPFALLTERLEPERDPSRPPLVAAMLTFEKAPAPELAALTAFTVGLPGVRLDVGTLSLESLPLAPPAAQLDLSLTAAELPSGLAVSLQWDADLFDPTTLGRMLGHLDRLLTGMAGMAAADPRQIAELPILAASERAQILLAWSGAENGPPVGTGCLHELFEAQAARTPEATALVTGEERWTYDTLNRRANRLAHHLRWLGAGPERRVGVLLGRSGELVAALLGVLKAGAAYVPLDPAYPEGRLAFAVEDAGITLLLTEERYAGKLAGCREIDAVNIADIADIAVSREPEENPKPLAGPGNLAYVMYTSGSTGRPKGVALEHRAPVERMLWAHAAFPAEALAGVLASTSIGFDLSVFEIFAPLSSGGTVILADNILSLPALPARSEVTLLNTVPSAMAQIAELAAGELPPALRTVNLAGEALPPQLAERIYRHAQIEKVVNLYGPTEDATYSTWARIERGAARVSIGRPLPGTRAYVLDGSLQPVPGGVPGELFLAGAGGARGYLGRPDLTAERFLPDAFGTEPGGRLYRTGDRARWLASGALEHLGRLDHQVKVRGFRIELGEIEAVLLTHPEVRQAAVLVRESAGSQALVAYVAGEEPRPTPAGLRDHLRRRLPEPMIPTFFVLLPALPLNLNGKVDRKDLPAPEWQRAEGSYLAPRTPVEEVLAGIWADVLGLPRVGATDHFFDLGGHSLLATQVMSRLRGALGIEVPVRDLFAAPRLLDFAARVEEWRRAGTVPAAPPLVAVPRERSLPLSFAQQRLWFIAELEPDSPLYNLPGALRVEGPLHGAVLELCLGEIVRRHEALRTVFAAPEGSPVQMIRPAEPFRLPVVDLSGLPEKARETQALALAGEEAGRPFDLGRGPLLRGLLVRLAPQDHAVVTTLHHIASDGWSLGVLVDEIAALYAALAAGRPSPLPELPVQYADFSLWQSSWLQGEVLEQEIDFWRRQLAGLPPLLELPTDRPRPAAQSFRGAARPVRLPAGLRRQAEALGRHSGATLFMVLLAGFQALLARYSGQDDLAVGSPVAGRTHREIEPLIGFFVNTLVLRGDLSGTPTFREFLDRVRETALAAYLHQDTPFEKLVEALAPERGLGQTPLFQAMLVLQNAPTRSLEIENLRLRPVSLETTTSKFDLTLILEHHESGLAGTVEYATDLFDAATIDRLSGHFERLLAAALAAPEQRVSALGFLGEVERQQTLVEWNDTSREPLDGALVHEAISARAERAPGALAVAWDGGELTYGELARRSDRLARQLRRLGVGPEVFVGLCCDRSGDLVVGVLGILKAGGAYVPLDPEYPQERLRHMLADCGAPVLVAQERTRGLAAAIGDQRGAQRGARLVWVDAPEPESGLPEEGPVSPWVSPENPAYVIYTSGSTGWPKGVVVTHGSLSSSTRARLAFYREPVEAYLLASSFAFDSSVAGLFWTLWEGGTLVLHRDQFQLDLPEFLATLAGRRASHLLCLPSLYALILEHAQPGQLASLKTVIVAGEACPPALIAQHAAELPTVSLVNEYGPTEGTVWSSACTLTATSPSRVVSIGRPIENVRLHLLDRDLGPVPAGAHGELWIAGTLLARGYLGRPDLTAERFLPDPFCGAPGARMYRTGDRVRSLPDGSLDFLGRLDHQVKVRGFRIELGEIEAALVVLPGVREGVVVVHEDRSAEGTLHRSLVAYVAGDVGGIGGIGGIAVEDLRRSLRERLPDYMVPAAFVRLAALPRTANGKVDRKALPAPQPPGEREGYVAPRTREEEILATVWAQVLRLPRVGVNDNFFELGGDSILSVQIAARARQAGLLFTVRQIFEHQTVAGLARHSTATDATAASGAQQGPVVGEVPLTPIERWFFAQDFAEPHHFNQALLLESLEPLDPAALERAMAAIIEHHDALRLRFDFQAGDWRQENAPAEPAELMSPMAPITPFHQVDLSGLPAPRFRAAFERAAAALQAGFDLSAGPLTRLTLFHAGAGQARLLWVTHHLVVDGISWRVLLEDLEEAYRQAARGLRPALPPKTTSFQEWARRLAEHAGSQASAVSATSATSAAWAGELEYWRKTAWAPVPRLPVDFPPGGTAETASLVRDEATVSFELSAEETTDLLQTLPAVYHNRIDDALLSALVRALAGWTGCPRLRVDLEGHGREPLFDDLDVSRTVGWFTSVYPVVLEAGDAGPGDALVSAKERLRAVPGRGIGYGLLRHLGVGGGEAARLLKSAPAAEILFNYLGQANATSEERSLFRASTASTGPSRSPRARRSHPLEIVGMVAEGRLRITLTYGSRTHRRETAERLAAAYAGALRQLIRHGRQSEEVFTPSDFPQARLNAKSLGKVAALLAGSD
jgi:amino acid adenylation domain-containing protein/non-ribosomal peptide synthase protein (TIGR01720 family)